jgi:hypothetical protein
MSTFFSVDVGLLCVCVCVCVCVAHHPVDHSLTAACSRCLRLSGVKMVLGNKADRATNRTVSQCACVRHSICFLCRSELVL